MVLSCTVSHESRCCKSTVDPWTMRGLGEQTSWAVKNLHIAKLASCIRKFSTEIETAVEQVKPMLFKGQLYFIDVINTNDQSILRRWSSIMWVGFIQLVENLKNKNQGFPEEQEFCLSCNIEILSVFWLAKYILLVACLWSILADTVASDSLWASSALKFRNFCKLW